MRGVQMRVDRGEHGRDVVRTSAAEPGILVLHALTKALQLSHVGARCLPRGIRENSGSQALVGRVDARFLSDSGQCDAAHPGGKRWRQQVHGAIEERENGLQERDPLRRRIDGRRRRQQLVDHGRLIRSVE